MGMFLPLFLSFCSNKSLAEKGSPGKENENKPVLLARKADESAIGQIYKRIKNEKAPYFYEAI